MKSLHEMGRREKAFVSWPQNEPAPYPSRWKAHETSVEAECFIVFDPVRAPPGHPSRVPRPNPSRHLRHLSRALPNPPAIPSCSHRSFLPAPVQQWQRSGAMDPPSSKDSEQRPPWRGKGAGAAASD